LDDGDLLLVLLRRRLREAGHRTREIHRHLLLFYYFVYLFVE
jgi:hypothetical protein